MAIVKSSAGFRDSRVDREFSSSSGGDESSGDAAMRAGSNSSSLGSEDGSDDASEVDSGMESDDFDYAGLGEAGAEFCQVGNQSSLIPHELYDLSDLKEVLSLDAWNNCLAEEDRLGLAEYLPDMDQETFMRTLRELLSGSNFHFSSPLAQMFEQLKGGLCEPRVVLYRRGLDYLKRREHYHRVAEYHNTMINSLVQIKDLWENCASYGIEEKLRVLNIQKSQRKLGYNEQGKVALKTDLDAEDDFVARWNRRLSNVGRQHYSPETSHPAISYQIRLREEPVILLKDQPKAMMKVGGSKSTHLKKGYTGSASKVGHAIGSNRKAALGPSRLEQPAPFDYGGRPRNKQKDHYLCDVDDADEADYEMENFETKAKYAKKQENSKRRHGQSPSVDYGDEEDQGYSGLSRLARKKDGNPSLASNDTYVSKKSRHLDVDRGGSARGSPEHLSLRGDWADGTFGYPHSRRGSVQKEAISMGHLEGYPERSSKKKSFNGEDLMKVYSQKSGSHVYSDRTTRSPLLNVRRKSSQSDGMDAEYINSRSSFLGTGETDSDSSEQQVEEDISTQVKKMKHSKTITEKHQNAMHGSLRVNNDARKAVIKGKKNGGLLSQMPEEDTYQLKMQKAHKSYTCGFASETLSPARLADDKKYMYDMDAEMKEDGYGGRTEMPMGKNHSAGRKRKGPDLELTPSSVRDYLSGTLLMDTDEAPDAFGNQVGMGMPGNSRTEFDNSGPLLMPHSGSKSLAAKRKLDKSRLQQGGSDKLADFVISKKNGKKKIEEGFPVIIPNHFSPEKETVAEPEPKPPRKQFTPITPTVHTGFSFSIVHLLSAVRKAMITVNAEDTAEGSGLDRRKDNADANPLEEQKGMTPLTVQEIVIRLKSNPGDPCILETQEPLQDLVRGVLKIFSSKTAPLGAKAWKPLVAYEKSTKSWSWIGPVSASTSEPVEEETSPEAWDIPHKMLVKLVDAFANWLKSGQETLRKIGSLPPPPVIVLPNLDEKERFKELRAQKSLHTISASSDEVRDYFRQEEFLRYQVPERAFSYTAADGKKSIVAPLRRGGGKPTSKARDHFMLKTNRPPHVTILCLVRDAAARLPGSIGTRADVCTLIRDSQYIVEDVSDNQVNQVVSGALDRLHYERDPCVQYDSDRKLWVYLHRDREEEDFEDDGTSSTKKWKRPRKETAETPDMGLVPDANQQFNGDQDVAGCAMYEFSSDPNTLPSSIHNGEKPELVYSDLRPTNENVEPLKNPIQVSSNQGHGMPWDVLGMNAVQHGNQMLCQQNCTNEEFDEEAFGRGRPVGLLNASLM